MKVCWPALTSPGRPAEEASSMLAVGLAKNMH